MRPDRSEASGERNVNLVNGQAPPRLAARWRLRQPPAVAGDAVCDRAARDFPNAGRPSGSLDSVSRSDRRLCRNLRPERWALCDGSILAICKTRRCSRCWGRSMAATDNLRCPTSGNRHRCWQRNRWARDGETARRSRQPAYRSPAALWRAQTVGAIRQWLPITRCRSVGGYRSPGNGAQRVHRVEHRRTELASRGSANSR